MCCYYIANIRRSKIAITKVVCTYLRNTAYLHRIMHIFIGEGNYMNVILINVYIIHGTCKIV